MAIRIAALAVEIIRGGQPERVKRDLKDIDRLGKKAGKSAMGLSNALKVVGVGFSVTAILRGLRSVTGSFLDFDAAMTESLAIMGDVSTGMREKMAEAAKSVAKTTTFSAAEAAESYFFLASAGLDAQQSIAALPQVAKFAQAGMFDIARATDLATDAQSALGLSVKDAQRNLVNLTRVTDVLVKANAISNATTQEFSEALTNKAGPALKMVGKSIEEGVAVLAAFAKQGIKGSEAGTALGIVMRDLQTKAIRNNLEFGSFGVAVFDANEKMRNMADIIGDLEGALDGMSDKQKKATLLQLGFSDKSVSFIQSILGESEAIRAYEEQLRKAGGTTEEVASKQLESFKAQLKLTTDTLNSMIITLVETVIPMFGFKDGLVDVREALEDVEFWIKNNEDAIFSWLNMTGKSMKLIAQSVNLASTSIADTFKMLGHALGNLAALYLGMLERDPILITVSLLQLKEDFLGEMGETHDVLMALIDDSIAVAAAMQNLQIGRRTQRPQGGQAPPGSPEGQRGPKQSQEEFQREFWRLTFAGYDLTLPDDLEARIEELSEQMAAFSANVFGKMIDEMAGTIESGLEETIGDAIFNGLEAAFDTTSLKGFFVEFGKTLLAGFGDILVQLGKILIQYGITMEALRPFLMNIFTAGPAAIAAGVALVALGSAFSSIVSSGGGAGRGMATAGAFREPSFSSFAQQQADISRTTISMGSSPTVQPQPAPIFYNVFIGPDDPSVQRQMAELMMKATRRGLRFT